MHAILPATCKTGKPSRRRRAGKNQRAGEIAKQVAVCRRHGAKGIVMFVLKAIDDATAEALGRTAFPGKVKPYRPPTVKR